MANVAEEDAAGESPMVAEVREIAAAEGAKAVVICGKTESEIAALPPDERPAFLEAMGLSESGLDRLIRAGYELLHLATFFTVGEDECKAWTIPAGWRAPQAAGRIHTDFEKGFIKAEVIRIEDLLELKTEAACREKGKLRMEGKEYTVQDGDVMHFRFNT